MPQKVIAKQGRVAERLQNGVHVARVAEISQASLTGLDDFSERMLKPMLHDKGVNNLP